VMRIMIHKAQLRPKRVVFPEGENEKILRAAHVLVEENIAQPILLGDEKIIEARAKDLGVALDQITVVNPKTAEKRDVYATNLYELRQRRGVTLSEAKEMIQNRNYFGPVMLHAGDADALLAGVDQHFPDTLRPALQVIKPRPGLHRVSGLYVVLTRRGDMYFLADCTVNIEPSAEDLAEIAICAALNAKRFNVTPRVAMLSLMVDGEMMADTAVTPEIIEGTYPFSKLRGGANVLVFPDLTSANTCYKLLKRIGGAETIGPIMMGMSKPVHVLQRGAEVEEIVNMSAIAVVHVQELEKRWEREVLEQIPAAKKEQNLQEVHN
jgi:malate dehydrogenase (oxaloacetate-decarboxylating)(NADP+)